MLIHDSATGIKEVKFDLKSIKTQPPDTTSKRRRTHFAVVDAITPPMNAQVPWPNDKAETTKNQSHR